MVKKQACLNASLAILILIYLSASHALLTLTYLNANHVRLILIYLSARHAISIQTKTYATQSYHAILIQLSLNVTDKNVH